MSAKLVCTACYICWLIHFNITLLATVYRNEWLKLTYSIVYSFTIHSVLSINKKSPIKKLLVSINQSNSGYSILTELKKQIYTQYNLEDYVCRYWVLCIFLVLFSKKIKLFHFFRRRQFFTRSCYRRGRIHIIDRNGIRILEDFSRL